MLLERSICTNICKDCAKPVVCISIPKHSDSVILELGNKAPDDSAQLFMYVEGLKLEVKT